MQNNQAGLKMDVIFAGYMRPDYPYKVFSDKRSNYILLVEALAIDSTV